MTQLVACYVVANEAEQIAESIRSCKAYVDAYVIVDSVFTTNPLPGTHSTDGTQELAERLCWPRPLQYLVPGQRLTEPEARNLYLEATRDQWVLVIDGDEQLLGDHAPALEVLARLRTGELGNAMEVDVLTVAVNANGNAPDLGPEVYATAPLISTRGRQARLLHNAAERGLRYAVSPIGIGHTVYDSTGEYAGWASAWTSELLIVNHHTRQPYDGYVRDFEWETRAIEEARA